MTPSSSDSFVNDTFVVGLVSVAALGGAAQWLGWRLRLPAILLLLLFGMAAGPDGIGLVPTDAMFGELLLPLVAIAVAILLFEGALTLHLPELGDQLRVVGRLVTLGAAVTWGMSAVAAHYVLELSWPLAILIGSVLTVTGPTVVLPLLRQIRPTGAGGAVLKWEGILIDPIGAVLAVLVFEALVDGAFATAFVGIGKTILFGSLFGLVPAAILVVCLERYWIPDHLHSAAALALALLGYGLSNAFQHESGLLAVTVMGVALANQHRVDISHITEFKENLQVLIISALFIVLAARVEWSDLEAIIGPRFGLFLLLLVLVVRPVTVALCTLDGRLTRRDRIFVSAMAPRGVVAAAVTAVFALRLEEEGFAGAEELVPIMFLIIAGSVAIYGLIGRPLALHLGLADRNPNGFVIIGAHPFARGLARAVQRADLPVLVVDTNIGLVGTAREEGLPVYHGSVLSDQAESDLELPGIGKLLALTANDEVNALSARHYVHLFGRQNLYQLSPTRAASKGSSELSAELRARVLGSPDLTYAELQRRFGSGAHFTSTSMTDQFGLPEWHAEHGADAVPLIVVRRSGEVLVATPGVALDAKPGDTVIGIT
jgi:NhaP-type Na+/H+ or K+/H+ antiporter